MIERILMSNNIVGKPRWDIDFDEDEQTSYPHKKMSKTTPTGVRSDPLTTFLGGIFGAGLYGLIWVLAHIFDIYVSPWPAIGLGVAVALGVRYAGGAGDGGFQTGAVVTIYVVALLICLGTMVYLDFNNLYTRTLAFTDYENEFVNRLGINSGYLDFLAANIGGFIAAALVSAGLRK